MRPVFIRKRHKFSDLPDSLTEQHSPNQRLKDFKQNSLIFVHAFCCKGLVEKEVQTVKAINSITGLDLLLV